MPIYFVIHFLVEKDTEVVYELLPGLVGEILPAVPGDREVDGVIHCFLSFWLRGWGSNPH